MFLVVLYVFSFLGVALCDLKVVVGCLKQPDICAAVKAKLDDFKVLTNLGMDPTTCNLPFITYEPKSTTTPSCPIPPGGNVGFICTVTADPTTKPTFDPKVFCEYGNLQVTQPCTDVVEEFLVLARKADTDCNQHDKELNPPSGDGRRRRNAPRPGFDVSF